MNIKPLVGRVLIKKIDTGSVGGVLIAKSSEEKLLRGEIVAIGPFEKDKSFDIKIGDIALFPSWSGTVVSNDSNGEYVIVKAEEISAVEV